MNNLQVFKNSEFGEIGVLLIDGKEYFPATACAKMLGYTNPHNAIRQHCRYSLKQGVPHPQSPGKVVEVNFIPEGDLYRLIIRSRLPAAERFERWVFDEVVPAIRKNGCYSAGEQIPPDRVLEIVRMTATAMITEFVKQVIPVLRERPDTYPESDDPEIVSTTTIIEKKRKRRNVPGKIERLPAHLQLEVSRMLEEDASYISVTDFLAKRGYYVSQMAVCRYYGKRFANHY